ncbi:protein SON [Pelodytes ibericus]
MATNIEQIFRSFVVNKFKEIQEEKLNSETTENSQNGELTQVTESTSEDTTVCVQSEGCEEAAQEIERMQSEPLDLEQPKSSALEENCTSKELKKTEVSSSDEVKKDGSRKKSKKHKKHKSKKKKKKKKKERNEKRSKSTSSDEDQENVKIEPKSMWKPAFSSPARETEIVDSLSKAEIVPESGTVSSTPSLDVLNVVSTDSEKESQPSKIQVDIDSGFFGPKCPNEISDIVSAVHCPGGESEMRDMCEESTATNRREIVKALEGNEKSCVEHTNPTNPQTDSSNLETETSLPPPTQTEIRESNSNDLERLDPSIPLPISEEIHHNSDKATCRPRSRSKSVGDVNQKTEVKARSRSKSLIKESRKQTVCSKSPVVEIRTRSSSSKHRRRSRSQSPVRNRRSRSSTPARYSKSPIRSWWSKSIKNRQRSRSPSVVRRRRSRTRSTARKCRSRTRSPTKRNRSKSRSTLRRRRSRSRSTSRKRRSRSRSTSKRRRSKSVVRRRSRSFSTSRRRRSRSSSTARQLRSRSQSAVRRRRSRSGSPVKSRRSRSLSPAKRPRSRSVVRRRRSRSFARRRRSLSRTAARRRQSRSASASRRRRSRSASAARRRRSRSGSASRRRRSRSGSASRRRRSRSGSVARRRRSRSGSVARRRRSRSGSVARRRRSRSGSVARRRRSRSGSVARRRRSRSGSVARRRRSRSGSAPMRRRSRSQSPVRKRQSRSRSAARRSRSSTKKQKSRSRSATKKQRSKSPPVGKKTLTSTLKAKSDDKIILNKPAVSDSKSPSQHQDQENVPVLMQSSSHKELNKNVDMYSLNVLPKFSSFSVQTANQEQQTAYSKPNATVLIEPLASSVPLNREQIPSVENPTEPFLDSITPVLLASYSKMPESYPSTQPSEKSSASTKVFHATSSPLKQPVSPGIGYTSASKDLHTPQLCDTMEELNSKHCNVGKDGEIQQIGFESGLARNSEMEFISHQPYALSSAEPRKHSNQVPVNVVTEKVFVASSTLKMDSAEVSLSVKPMPLMSDCQKCNSHDLFYDKLNLDSNQGSDTSPSVVQCVQSVVPEHKNSGPFLVAENALRTYSQADEKEPVIEQLSSTTSIPVRTEVAMSLLSLSATEYVSTKKTSTVVLFEANEIAVQEPNINDELRYVSPLPSIVPLKETVESRISPTPENFMYSKGDPAVLDEHLLNLKTNTINYSSTKVHECSNISINSKDSVGCEKNETLVSIPTENNSVSFVENHSSPMFEESGHHLTEFQETFNPGTFSKQEKLMPDKNIERVQQDYYSTPHTRVISDPSHIKDKGICHTILHSDSSPAIGIGHSETVLENKALHSNKPTDATAEMNQNWENIEKYKAIIVDHNISLAIIEGKRQGRPSVELVHDSNAAAEKNFLKSDLSSESLHKNIVTDGSKMKTASCGAINLQVDTSNTPSEQEPPNFPEILIDKSSPVLGNDTKSHTVRSGEMIFHSSAPQLSAQQEQSELKVLILQPGNRLTTELDVHDSHPSCYSDKVLQSLKFSEPLVSPLSQDANLCSHPTSSNTDIQVSTEQETTHISRKTATSQKQNKTVTSAMQLVSKDSVPPNRQECNILENPSVCKFPYLQQENILKSSEPNELLVGRAKDELYPSQDVMKACTNVETVGQISNADNACFIYGDPEKDKSLVTCPQYVACVKTQEERPSEPRKPTDMSADQTRRSHLQFMKKQEHSHTSVSDLEETVEKSVSLSTAVRKPELYEVGTNISTDELEERHSKKPPTKLADIILDSKSVCNVAGETKQKKSSVGKSVSLIKSFDVEKVVTQKSSTKARQLDSDPSTTKRKESMFDLLLEKDSRTNAEHVSLSDDLESMCNVPQSEYDLKIRTPAHIGQSETITHFSTDVPLTTFQNQDSKTVKCHTPETDRLKGPEVTKTKGLRSNSGADVGEQGLSTVPSDSLVHEPSQNKDKEQTNQFLPFLIPKHEAQKSHADSGQHINPSTAAAMPLNFKFSRTFKPINIVPVQVNSDPSVSFDVEPLKVGSSSTREPLKLKPSTLDSTKSNLQLMESKLLCFEKPKDSCTTSVPEPQESQAVSALKSSSMIIQGNKQSSFRPALEQPVFSTHTIMEPAQLWPLHSDSYVDIQPLQSSSLKPKETQVLQETLESESQSKESSGTFGLNQTDASIETELSQSSAIIKHAFPHLSNVPSKMGVKQRQYRSRSMAQESRSPSVDRGRTSRSRSKSTTRKRRSRSKSVTRKRRSHSSTRKRQSRSKSVRRRRSRSKSGGKKKRSRSKSKGRKKHSPSRLSGKRRHSRSKSGEKRRSKSTGRRRMRSKSPGRRRHSRSRSAARRKRSRSRLGRRRVSGSKSPAWRRRSHSKSVSSKSRSRSKSASFKRRSPSKSTKQRRRSRSSSKSTSPKRRTHSRKGRSTSRSPAPWRRTRSKSSTRRRNSQSRGRWRRSRSLSTSRHRSRSASRLSRSLSNKKPRHSLSKSPTRRRRSRSQTRLQEKSPLSRHKSKSTSPPQRKLQSKSAAFKHSIGLKSLIQKQLSQVKLQSSNAKVPSKEQLTLPSLTGKTQINMASLTLKTQLPNSNKAARIQMPTSKLTARSQLPTPNLTARSNLSVPNLTTESQLPVSDLTTETGPQMSISELATGTQWPGPDVSAGAQWAVSDLTPGTQWTMPDLTAGGQWPVTELTTGAQWPVTDLAVGTHWPVADLATGSQWALSDLTPGSQWSMPDIASGSPWTVPDLAAGSQWTVPTMASETQWAVSHLASATQWTVPNLPTATQVPGSCLVTEAQVSVPKLVQTTQMAVPDLFPPTQVAAPELTSGTQVTAPELAPATQVTAPELAPATQVTAPELAPATQVTAPELPPATQVTAPELPPATQVTAPELAPATQVTAPELAPATQVTAPELAPATQVTAPELAPATQVTAPELAPPTQVTAPELAPPTQVTAPELAPPTQVTAPELAPPTQVTAPELAPPTQVTAPELAPPTQVTAPELAPPTQVTAPELAPPTQVTAPELAPATQVTAPELENQTMVSVRTDLTPTQAINCKSKSGYEKNWPLLQISLPCKPLNEQFLSPEQSQKCILAKHPIATHCVKPGDAIATSHLLPKESFTNEPYTIPKHTIPTEGSNNMDQLLKEVNFEDEYQLLTKPSASPDVPLSGIPSTCPEVSLIAGNIDIPAASTDFHLKSETCVDSRQTILAELIDRSKQPLFSELSSSNRSELKAEADASPEHGLLVEPYVSPEHSLLTEPCDSPGHAILVESYSSPYNPLLVEPYASPDHSLPFVTDARSDCSFLPEPNAPSEPLISSEPCTSPVSSLSAQLYTVPNHSLLGESHTNLSQPLLTESCDVHNPTLRNDISSNAGGLTLVAPYVSPVRPILVEPYASPHRPLLVEPYASPDHSPLVEFSVSPDHSSLTEQYSSPNQSPLIEPYASPDRSLLPEHYDNPGLSTVPESYGDPEVSPVHESYSRPYVSPEEDSFPARLCARPAGSLSIKPYASPADTLLPGPCASNTHPLPNDLIGSQICPHPADLDASPPSPTPPEVHASPSHPHPSEPHNIPVYPITTESYEDSDCSTVMKPCSSPIQPFMSPAPCTVLPLPEPCVNLDNSLLASESHACPNTVLVISKPYTSPDCHTAAVEPSASLHTALLSARSRPDCLLQESESSTSPDLPLLESKTCSSSEHQFLALETRCSPEHRRLSPETFSSSNCSGVDKPHSSHTEHCASLRLTPLDTFYTSSSLLRSGNSTGSYCNTTTTSDRSLTNVDGCESHLNHPEEPCGSSSQPQLGEPCDSPSQPLPNELCLNIHHPLQSECSTRPILPLINKVSVTADHPLPDEPLGSPVYPLPDEPVGSPDHPLPDEPLGSPDHQRSDEPFGSPNCPHPDEPLGSPDRPLPDEPHGCFDRPLPDEPHGSPDRPLPDEPRGSPDRPLPDEPRGSPDRPLPDEPRGSPDRPLPDEPRGSPDRPLPDEPRGSPDRPLPDEPLGCPDRPLPDEPRGCPDRPLPDEPRGCPDRPLPDEPRGSPDRPLPDEPRGSPDRPLPDEPRGSPDRPLPEELCSSPDRPLPDEPHHYLERPLPDEPLGCPGRPLLEEPIRVGCPIQEKHSITEYPLSDYSPSSREQPLLQKPNLSLDSTVMNDICPNTGVVLAVSHSNRPGLDQENITVQHPVVSRLSQNSEPFIDIDGALATDNPLCATGAPFDKDCTSSPVELIPSFSESSNVLHTDKHYKTTPPNLLPYDSEQPAVLHSSIVEPLSEQIFHSQPPPELLPYDSEQPANPYLSIADYSSEQVSSVFHTPPELLPYDSDQPAVLRAHNLETSTEKNLSVDMTSANVSIQSEVPFMVASPEPGHSPLQFSMPSCPDSINLGSKNRQVDDQHLVTSDMQMTDGSTCEKLMSVYKVKSIVQHDTIDDNLLEQPEEEPVTTSQLSTERSQSPTEKYRHCNLEVLYAIEPDEKMHPVSESKSELPTELLSETAECFIVQKPSEFSMLEEAIPKDLTKQNVIPGLLEQAIKQHYDENKVKEQYNTVSVLESSDKQAHSEPITKQDCPSSQSVSRSRHSRSKSPGRKKRSQSRSEDVKRSRSRSTTRRKRSRSKSVARKRKSRSKSAVKKKRSRSRSTTRRRRSRSKSVSRKKRSRSTSANRKKRSRSPVSRKRRSRSRSVARKRRSRSPSVTRKRRSRSPSVARKRRSRSQSVARKRRSRSPSVARKRRSRSPSVARKRRSRSPSVTRKRRSRSPSVTRKRRSRSPSVTRKRRSRSPSVTRKRRSRSPSVTRKRRSRSPSVTRKRRSRSPSVTRKRRSRSPSVARKRRSRSPSVTRKRRSNSKSLSPKSPVHKPRARSKSYRSRSRSQSNITRKRKTRSRSASKDKNKSSEKRRRRSNSKDYSVKSRRRSRTPPRRKKSRSPGRRTGLCISPIRRRRSRSPVRRKSFSRSPIRRKRSRSREKSQESCRSPKRLTDLDKAQLLEIAKANAAAMCVKAGVPLPASLKPASTPSASTEEKITHRTYGVTIQELTEKCKQIAQSKEDDVIINKPHDSDEEEEERPFYNHPFKVNEHKPISFSLLNPTVKAAPKNQVTLTKEFPVSSGSQHRKKESDKVYGEWVPVDKKTEESKDDVFTSTAPSQPVDITSAMNERAVAQSRLTGNPFDLEALFLLNRAQEQIDAWAQSTSLPGQFTGSTGAQVLTADEISNSGPQAWLKKDQFLKAAPVSGGRGALLMRKMGWREGEGLGRHNEGNVNPILIDFKTDRKGLVADGEKAPNKLALPVMKDLSGKHPISALMELCNKKKWSPPEFVLVDDTGPEHRKRFLFRVTVNGAVHQPSQPSVNKKLAKATAAAAALQALGALPKDSMTSTTNFRSASSSTS